MNNQLNYNFTGFNPGISTAVAQELKQYLNLEKIPDLTPIEIGHVNKSFLIQTNEDKFFCKVSPLWYKNSLTREEWCLRLLEERGAPVPRVIGLIKDDNTMLRGHEVLILEYIEGDLLSRIPILPEHYKSLYNIYNILHSQPMALYGWLDANFKGTKESWKDFLVDIENIEQCKSISHEWKNKITTVVERLSSHQYNMEKGRLLYGDFNLDNFIWTPSGKLVGLDFQNCFSGDPLYDFAVIINKYPLFYKYIEDKHTLDQKTLDLYHLRFLLTRLSFFYQNNNHVYIKGIEKKFNTIFNKLFYK